LSVFGLKAKPRTVYGDGKQTRSFCYITDTITGLMMLTVSEKVKGEVVNLGNAKEVTILQLVEKIKELTKSRSQLTFHPLPEDDPKRRCPDISLAKRLSWVGSQKLVYSKVLRELLRGFRERMHERSQKARGLGVYGFRFVFLCYSAHVARCVHLVGGYFLWHSFAGVEYS